MAAGLENPAPTSQDNFQTVWCRCTTETPNDQFLLVSAVDSLKVLNYRVSSFYRRIARLAGAFNRLLHLPEGARIAVLSADANDLALVLHGAWLARLVVVPIDTTWPSGEIARILSLTAPRVVIFSPETAGKVAAFFAAARQVKHWFVSGSSSFAAGLVGVRRFDDLMAAAAEEDLPLNSAECGALIVASAGAAGPPKLMEFSQTSLIRAAQALAEWYPDNSAEDQSCWVALSWYSLSGLLHSFVVPLFSGVPVWLNKDLEMRRFWDHVRANKFTRAILAQSDFRQICRRGKSGRPLLNSNKLGVLLYTREAFSPELQRQWEQISGVAVTLVYSHSEAGGMVTKTNGGSPAGEWRTAMEVACSGSPGPGMDVVVRGADGREREEEVLGELWLRSPYGMSHYIEGSARELDHDKAGYFPSGDEGFYKTDGEGRKYFFIFGRQDELIERDGLCLYPNPIENRMLVLRGIDAVRVVGFPNGAVGYEVGAYVIPFRAANLIEADVVAAAAEILDWLETPKVVIFGEWPDESRELPPRSELVELFDEYYGIDWSSPKS